jgi:hypothetical protein
MKSKESLGKIGDILTESFIKDHGITVVEKPEIEKVSNSPEEIVVSEAQSLQDIRLALDKVINGQYNYNAYIEDWDKSFVYYAKNYEDKIYYKQAYTYDKSTKIATLVGDQVKVERSWKKMREAVANARLIESKSPDGSIWKVGLIDAGKSLNGYVYSSNLLRESASLFEGTKAYLRTDAEHLSDTNKSISNLAGIHKDVKFNASEARLESNFHIVDTGLRTKLLEAERLGVLDELGGLSIVAEGVATKQLREGKVEFNVTKLTKVSSVDPVAVPSAGGKFIKLAASKNKEGDIVLIEKMIEALKKHSDLYSQIDPDNVDEEKVFELYGEVKVKEALATKPAPDLEVKPEVKPEIKPEAKIDIKEAEDRLTQRMDLLEQQYACKNMLITKLVESKLPTGGQKLVKNQFPDATIFTDKDVDTAIDEVRTILAEASPTGKIKGFGATITVGKEDRDKWQKAMNGFFSGKDEEGIPRFRSFRESFKEVTDNYRMTDDDLSRSIFAAARYVDSVSNKERARQLTVFAESLTSASWTQILGDSITRQMVAEYNAPKYSDWRKIVSNVTPVRDFRTNRRMRIGGYADLPTVNESGAYLNLASPGDEEATYAINKKGGLEDLTLEMIANDDVGSIRLIPRNLGRAAVRTLYKEVMALITDNSATTYDAVALFHASHNNLGATALNATTLEAATVAMMGQTSYGGTTGDELGNMPKYLMTPLALRDTAFRLTTSPSLIGAANEAGTEPNIHSTQGLQVLIVPHWSDANDWALVCDPMDCPTIEVGFYSGREEPELFVQDSPNIGTPFSNDVITYKIRHIYGICVLEHRGMYKAVVA